MSTPHVTVTRSGDLTHIRLTRPEKRNALTAEMYAAMADALVAAETDGTGVVLLSGEGKGFTAGNDLGDFIARPPASDDAPVTRFLRAIANSSRILVAAVQGRAVGVGTTLLLHCDFVIADSTAILQMPFTDLALVPEAGSSLLVPALMGHQRAAGLLMLGEPLDAEAARAAGLVREVVAEGEALAAASRLAETILAKPRQAILTTKRLMKSPNRELAARMAEEGQAFSAQLKTPELQATIAQFFAARNKAA